MAGKSKAPLITAAVVGVAAIVVIRVLTNGGGEQSAQQGSPPGKSGCTPLQVAASSEKAALLSKLADRYNASAEVGGKCAHVTVAAVASGSGETALARGWKERVDGPAPDVWTPAASTWVGLLEQDLAGNDRPDIVPDDSPSIAQTPLVLAMPRPMAEALGWPKKQLGWADLSKLATSSTGWGAYGHPEWGRFTLGKTNPNISTSGLAATVGAFVAATGKSSDLTSADVENPKVRMFVQDIERSVIHYGDTTLTFLSNLQRADDRGAGLGYVSAVAVEEKSVLDYNAGNPTGNVATLGDHAKPKVPLAAIYPKEGTLVSDSPWVVLDAPWATEAKQAVAKDFLDYLRGDSAQKAFTDAFFRTYDGKPGAPITSSDDVLADGVKITLNPPSPGVLDQVRAAWTDLRKPARVLLLLDDSGSMGEAVGSQGATKLELAQAAAVSSLGQFASHDAVGAWKFTTGLGSGNDIVEELVPVQPISQNQQQLRRSIAALIPLNGTPLYAAIREAVAAMEQGYDPNRINAVVVLTDGRNEYPEDTDLEGLLDDLGNGSSESPMRVFSIAYGEDADLETLQRISEASNAAAYDATNPETIQRVFNAVLSNF